MQHDGDELGQGLGRGLVPAGELARLGQRQPVEPVARQGQAVAGLGDRGEVGAAQQLDRDAVAVAGELEIAGLGVAGQVVDAQDRLALVLAQIGQDLAVARVEEGQGAAAEGRRAWRTAISRFIQLSSEPGLCCCASTLTAW